MSATRSWPLDAAGFRALLRRLRAEGPVDAFVSGGAHSGERCSYAGVEQARAWVVKPETQPDALRGFAAAAPGPVLGFLTYDFALRGRTRAAGKVDPLPLGLFRAYRTLAEHDVAASRLSVYGDPRPIERALRRGDVPLQSWKARSGDPRPSMDAATYQAGVERAVEAIRDGKVYQLNLSVAFDAELDSAQAFGLFSHLLERHPAPYYAWFELDGHRLISTSPERFLRVEGGVAHTQPIKGTRALAPGEDATAAAERLRTSPKEAAELAMIVDLMRNDLAQSCTPGTVRVRDPQSVFQVDDLLQMCTTVQGDLSEGVDAIDVFWRAFPGGSITGCPKAAAIDLIEELEPHARGIYCGCFVRLDGPDDLEASVAIRTARVDVDAGTVRFYAGSGIVVDSDPAAEHAETLAKAEKFRRILTG